MEDRTKVGLAGAGGSWAGGMAGTMAGTAAGAIAGRGNPVSTIAGGVAGMSGGAALGGRAGARHYAKKTGMSEGQVKKAGRRAAVGGALTGGNFLGAGGGIGAYTGTHPKHNSGMTPNVGNKVGR